MASPKQPNYRLPLTNCACRNLSGFATQAMFVDSAQSQTRDAFGRRIETKEYLGDYTRNLYDGFSFDVLGKSVLQSAYSANVPVQKYRDGQSGHPERSASTERSLRSNVSGSAPNNRTSLGSEIGTRYRYIDDTPLVSMAEAGKANGTNTASSASGAKTRSRPNNEYVLYSYGEPVGMTNDGETSYFGTDILGSVRSVTDKYGTVQADYSYDVFGSPYLGNLENDIGFGYCGKVYDIGTGLYDYGFRDYSPVSARFTTIDPIRDGSNWFSYVVNDPVNYVDPFGLSTSDRSSSPNFNSGMFGQNVGFNGFTNYTSTGYNSQSSISPFGSYLSTTTTGHTFSISNSQQTDSSLNNVNRTCRNNIIIYVYRDSRSYEISADRNNPKNTYLDKIMICNTETQESVVFEKAQTVANYPNTDSKNRTVDLCFADTIAPGVVDIKFYTTTDVAPGLAAIITNAKTIDGRTVDANGYTENPLSSGRGLIHSDEINDGTGNTYNTPYSKQCFILPKSDHKEFFDKMNEWGVEDGDVIKTLIIDVDNTN